MCLYVYVCMYLRARARAWVRQVLLLRKQLVPYMLRREKEEVEKLIPPKEELIVEVEMSQVSAAKLRHSLLQRLYCNKDRSKHQFAILGLGVVLV